MFLWLFGSLAVEKGGARAGEAVFDGKWESGGGCGRGLEYEKNSTCAVFCALFWGFMKGHVGLGMVDGDCWFVVRL